MDPYDYVSAQPVTSYNPDGYAYESSDESYDIPEDEEFNYLDSYEETYGYIPEDGEKGEDPADVQINNYGQYWDDEVWEEQYPESWIPSPPSPSDPSIQTEYILTPDQSNLYLDPKVLNDGFCELYPELCEGRAGRGLPVRNLGGLVESLNGTDPVDGGKAKEGLPILKHVDLPGLGLALLLILLVLLGLGLGWDSEVSDHHIRESHRD